MTTIGSIQLIASIDTSKYKRGANEIDKTNDQLSGSTEKTGSRMSKSFTKVAKVGIAAVAAAAVALGATIVSHIGSAVKRVDTLNNFPKVMANLGYQTEESTKALNELDQGVRGLPTALDAIASAMQNIAPSTSSLDEATKLTLALNNALIAGGKETSIQATAMEQFSQAIAKGKPDMMEWRSLATAMPGQLKQISNSLGYDNWQKMAEAVSSGELEFAKVTDTITELNQKGLGKFPSFAEQAKNAAGGLQTGWANMQTGITRGVAKIIEAIGSDELNQGMKTTGQLFEAVLTGIANAFSFVIKAIQLVVQWLQPLLNYINQNKQVMEVLKTTLIVLGAILLGAVLAGIIVVVGAATLLVGVIDVLIKVFTWVMDTAVAAWNGIVGAWGAATKFFSGIWKGIQKTFGGVKNWFTNIFSGAVRGVKDTFSGITGFFGDIWQKITGIFDGAKNLGKNIVEGLWNGINDMGGWIAGKLKGFGEGVLGSIKDFFGIKSPSRLMRDQVGKFIGQGIGVGITDSTKDAVNAAKRSSSAILGGFGDMSTDYALNGSTSFTRGLDTSSFGSSSTSNSTNITINLSGTFATSKAEQRKVAETIVQRIQEVQQSKALGGAI